MRLHAELRYGIVSGASKQVCGSGYLCLTWTRRAHAPRGMIAAATTSVSTCRPKTRWARSLPKYPGQGRCEGADVLTNGNFSAFDPSRSVDVRIHELPWIVLPQMLAAAEDIYMAAKTLREKKVQERERRSGPETTLRQRAPWG